MAHGRPVMPMAMPMSQHNGSFSGSLVPSNLGSESAPPALLPSVPLAKPLVNGAQREMGTSSAKVRPF